MDISGLIPGLVSTFSCFCHTATMEEGNSLWFCLLSGACKQCLALSAFLFCPSSPASDCIYLHWCTFWQLTTLLGASFAYIVDQCKEKKQRTIRIAIIDFLFGVVSGLTGLSSSYFIRGLGFVWSFWLLLVGSLWTCFMFYFFLRIRWKSLHLRIFLYRGPKPLKTYFHRTHAFLKMLLWAAVFVLFVAFHDDHLLFVTIGVSIFVLYELDYACWDEVLIGYGSALGSFTFFSSFLGIWLFSYCMDVYSHGLQGTFTTMVGMAILLLPEQHWWCF